MSAAADGIAVGAAAVSDDLSISVTIGVAIMLHKLPVALSLGAYLRSSALTQSQAHAGQDIHFMVPYHDLLCAA